MLTDIYGFGQTMLELETIYEALVLGKNETMHC